MFATNPSVKGLDFLPISPFVPLLAWRISYLIHSILMICATCVRNTQKYTPDGRFSQENSTLYNPWANLCFSNNVSWPSMSNTVNVTSSSCSSQKVIVVLSLNGFG